MQSFYSHAVVGEHFMISVCKGCSGSSLVLFQTQCPQRACAGTMIKAEKTTSERNVRTVLEEKEPAQEWHQRMDWTAPLKGKLDFLGDDAIVLECGLREKQRSTLTLK